MIVALTSFSERAAAHASPTDRGVARILLFIVPVAMWLFVFPLIGMDVDIRIGGKSWREHRGSGLAGDNR